MTDLILQKLADPSIERGFTDPRHCLVCWARPPSHIRSLAGDLQQKLLALAPSTFLNVSSFIRGTISPMEERTVSNTWLTDRRSLAHASRKYAPHGLGNHPFRDQPRGPFNYCYNRPSNHRRRGRLHVLPPSTAHQAHALVRRCSHRSIIRPRCRRRSSPLQLQLIRKKHGG